MPARLCSSLSLAVSLAALPVTLASAQSPDSLLQIRVVDRSGAALPGATVRLLPPGGGQPVVMQTSAAGLLRVRLPGGLVTLTAEHPGFRPLTEDIALSPATRPVTVTLAVASDTVTAEVIADGFAPVEATSATRTPLRLSETPQQVAVITSEVLRSRASESMKSAAELDPAVGLQLGEGRRDNFFIRGFNAVADMYIDGIRDDAQYYRDLSNTDHLEIVEGPAAALYGRGSSGGLINRVTKKPGLEGGFGEFSYTAGSYGEQRGEGDLNTVIPGTHRTAALRLTGAAESEGSHRHDFRESRYSFAPTLLWQPSEHTAITAQVERLRDERLPDRGIPYLPATGLPAPVPVGDFYGYVGPQPGSNFITAAVTDGTLDERYTLASRWTLHATQRLAGYATNFANMYASAVIPIAGTPGDYSVARGEYNGRQNWRTAFANLEASSRGLRFAGLTHTLLLGSEYGRETTDATQFTGPSNQTPVDLLNPQPVAPVLSSTLSKNNRFLAQTAAVYAQDLVTAGTHWKALAGIRFDSFRQALELRPPTNTTPNLVRTDNDFSPRVGLVYEPRHWASLYANYSRTFDPSGENLSLAANNAQLAPELTQNYETGLKLSPLGDRLLATASVFRLDRTGIKTTDPNNPNALLNLGEQRTDGVELTLQGSPARRWQITGGYAWLDARIVGSTTVSNGVLLAGKRPAMTPLHAGSLWTTYTLAHGFGLGSGVITRAHQFAATDNLARLPAYARLDATVFFRRPRYELQANLQNLTNSRIYDAAQSDFQIFPAAPISGTVTARYRF